MRTSVILASLAAGVILSPVAAWAPPPGPFYPATVLDASQVEYQDNVRRELTGRVLIEIVLQNGNGS
jgi:hypothetical protein